MSVRNCIGIAFKLQLLSLAVINWGCSAVTNAQSEDRHMPKCTCRSELARRIYFAYVKMNQSKPLQIYSLTPKLWEFDVDSTQLSCFLMDRSDQTQARVKKELRQCLIDSDKDDDGDKNNVNVFSLR